MVQINIEINNIPNNLILFIFYILFNATFRENQMHPAIVPKIFFQMAAYKLVDESEISSWNFQENKNKHFMAQFENFSTKYEQF